ncbi:MAG: hypothetical protein FWD26_08255 [Treponema sp.]|nr:hypothetical protein [Treponema sp.]
MPVLVKVMFGTSKDNASAGKLKRWKEHFGIMGPKCSEAACLESENLLGTPIEVFEGRNKGKKFIVPLCNPLYKQHGEELHIKDTAKCMPLEDLQ